MKEDIKIVEEWLEQNRIAFKNFFGESMVIPRKREEAYKYFKQIKALENLLTRYKEMEADNKKYEEIYKTYGVDDFVKRIRKLEKENEEWQRAYQEEKDKQFELLRENKELKEDNEQLEAIKDEAIRRYNFESIPISLVKEKIEETEKQIDDLVQNGDVYGDNLAKYNDLKLKIEVIQELLES